MRLRHLLPVAPLALASSLLLPACPAPETPFVTRFHLQNESGAPLIDFAIADSQEALEEAENRLAQPIEPDTVYSVRLERPGNYWLRTAFHEGEHTIERVEGPFRIARGISNWRFTREDAEPLYGAAGRVIALAVPGDQRPAAGRMSFNSN